MKNKSQASRGRVTPPQFLLLSKREGSGKWTLWCFQAVITFSSRHIPLWGILHRASTLASKEQVRKEVVDIYLFQETLWIIASGFSSRFKGMRYFSPGFLDGYFPLQLYFNTHWKETYFMKYILLFSSFSFRIQDGRNYHPIPWRIKLKARCSQTGTKNIQE